MIYPNIEKEHSNITPGMPELANIVHDFDWLDVPKCYFLIGYHVTTRT